MWTPLLISVASLALCSARSDLDDKWNQFKRHYKRIYLNGEEGQRRAVWEDNIHFITKHNLEYDMGVHSYFLGINEYTDIRHDEFVKRMNGYRVSNQTSGHVFAAQSDFTAPPSVDWRQHGYVTRIKNQERCGSCWAFSATGSLEGQHFKKTGKLVSLSEQQLIDCDHNSDGCGGGDFDLAFLFVKHNGGIATERDYSYTADEGTCRTVTSLGATCSGYRDIKRSEHHLQLAVATVGPVSVGIDASHKSMQFYRGGVYDEPKCSTTQLDHAVLVVGYGDDHAAYWLVKNSWGTTWGDRGYIKMSRDKNNQCGIASAASYPIV